VLAGRRIAQTAEKPRRRLIHLGLFLLTVVTTMFVGSQHYAGFASDFVADLPAVSFIHGAWYSVTILAILGTHEMGHYLACRYYGVDASLP
jgi:ABC-type arginine transport system permease subunit